MIDNITLGKYKLHTYVFTLNIGTKYSNRICMGTLTSIHIHIINMHVKFFMTVSFSSHQLNFFSLD